MNYVRPACMFPLAILIIYGRMLNSVGLVSFSLATVIYSILVASVGCIMYKSIMCRRYLVSYLSHFSPVGVSSKSRPFQASFISDPAHPSNRHLSRKGNGHFYSAANLTRMTVGKPCTASCPQGSSPLVHHYRDLNLIQGLARMVGLLETFRTLIRPASLSLRFCANMACGHILVVLSSSPNVPLSAPLILGPVSFIYALETLVCFVQCYVFYTLWRMYLAE